MVKFLGVISNSAPANTGERVLEYSDLDLLTNFLYRETQNLFEDFVRKLEFVNEREMLILENAQKFKEIYDFCQALGVTSVDIERGTDEVGLCLGEMEKLINSIEKQPNDTLGCKCSSNADRNKMLDELLQLSKDLNNIENELGEVEREEEYMAVKDPCCLDNRLIPFLDVHTKILEQVEHKIYKITDLLQEVNEMFEYINKKIRGKNYHKPRYDYGTDC